MTEQPLASDAELLAIAQAVLTDQGYHVERTGDTVDLLLAENAYFVIAVAATQTLQGLILNQGIAESALTERLTSSAVGPKKWDAYLVLLTQERSPEDDATTRELYAINYDTARLRRIAHMGVDPTTESVSRALAPFVAPIEVAASNVHANPFKALVDALAVRGVDRDLASRAITAFEQGASLDDVL